jgi:uncharacterized protein YkwD
MRSIVRRLAVLALAPIAALGVVAVASPAQAVTIAQLGQMQHDILVRTNAQRAAHGCAALRSDAKIAYAARVQSNYMARTGVFSHTGSGGSTFATRIRAQGYTAPLAENIAWGYPTAAGVVSAWMASPGHRANILNCKAKAAGVGVAYSANGTPYYTEDFGSR